MHLDFTTALLNVALLWLLTTPHEFAHAWTATRLGDDTPRLQGRLTLNPLAHVDWLGTTILPALTSLVAMAGPASNVVFAVILAAVARATVTFAPALAQFAARGVNLSLYLAIFNMLPVPPLDGSKLLLAARIPMVVYNELARAGFLLLIFAVSVSDLGRWMSQWSYEGTAHIFGLFR